MPLTGNTKIQSSVQAKTQVTGDLANSVTTTNSVLTYNWTSGTGNNQAQYEWTDERTVTTGADDDLDLAGGLTNVAGETLTFTKIKSIRIENRDTTASNVLHIKPASSNGFGTWIGGTTPYIIIRGGYSAGVNAGGSFTLVAPDATGYAVTAGTGDVLRITNPNAGSVTYQIIIVGV